MPRFVALLAVLLFASALADAEEPDKKKKPKPPPLPGIHWEADLDAGFARAAREGRPILFCINALEDEGANIGLATRIYPSAEWGTSTRGYVAFVCNPNDHDGPDGFSTRYPGTRSATAQAALAYVMKRFGKDLISPQHIILEPDGDLAYRKEYYERIVSPRLLDTWLARISPPVAFARANIDREAEINALAKASNEELGAKTVEWLKSHDGLAVVGVISTLDDEYDAARRLVLIASLSNASTLQATALAYGADERVSYPDEEPAETRAWLETLFAVDRATGVVAAARALARLPDRAERDAVLRIWKTGTDEGSTPTWDQLPKQERPLALEALMLAGDTRVFSVKDPDGVDEDMHRRLARARVMAGITTREGASLEEALQDGRPGVLYRALLDANADEVRGQEALVREAFQSPHRRIRIAAALALLWAGSSEEAGEIAEVISLAVFDSVDGPETRAQAVARLDDDPGESPREWVEAIIVRLSQGGGR